MKSKLTLLLGCLTVITALGLQDRLAAQRPQVPAKATLPDVEVLSAMRVGDATQDSGVPRADLVIKDMCFNTQPNFKSVNVLVANIGTVDAGPFELGFEYTNAEGASRFARDKINGLKAGEEHWEMEFHMCCGLVPSMILVEWASRYQAIADPKYFTAGSLPGQGKEVKPVIPESNESNNKMSANKSDMRSCQTVKAIEAPRPARIAPIRKP